MQDGELTENDTQKAEVLNAFFHSVFTEEDKNDLPIFKKQTDAILSYVNITEKDMQKALSNLNTSKSQGPDLLHPRILKELSNELSYPLKNFLIDL